MTDFRFFMAEILKMPLKEKPHYEMASFLDDDTQPSKLMLVPRDCWKTSIGTMAYPLWRVLRAHFMEKDSAFRVLIDSATVRLSQFVLEAIVSYVQTCEGLIACYGNLYDRKQSKENWVSLSFRHGNAAGIKEPHFLASGVNAAKTGLHFDLIILDDLVTKENVNTVDQREKVWTHYRMMYGILEADSSGQTTQMHIHGTRYHDDDLYGRILAEEKKRISEGHLPNFSIMERAAINDGELFYPSVLTEAELLRRKSTMHGLFWAQYMNDPNRESAPFKAEQLHFTPLVNFPDKLQMIRLTCDAAVKEESVAHGDYNAICVAGWDRWRKPWILDASLKRDLTVGAMIDTTLDMAWRWKVEQILIEDRSGELLFPLFQQEMIRRRQFFPLHMIKPNALAGKMSRWAKLQSIADRGGIHVAAEIPENVKLEIADEWSRAPFARFDDFMDALEMQMTFLAIEDEGEGIESVSPERNPLEILDEARQSESNRARRTLESVFPHLRVGANDEPELEEEPLESEALAWP